MCVYLLILEQKDHFMKHLKNFLSDFLEHLRVFCLLKL